MISLFLAGTLIAQATSDVTTTQQPASPTAAETKTSDQATKPPQQVDTIVVTARAPTRESRIDRVVYDVRTLPDAPASAAVDAIGLLPGVFVGANNRITMVGGAFVTVLVDGKSMPRAAALQIPANQIARIEVMSNPPAEFASSAQAVINIITKKAQEDDKLGGTLAGSINTIDNQAMTLSFN
ncbi:MAG: TonB-dependent receptor plug domain-containing protein, partial [Hyphomonadaceae bacterium]